MNPTCECVSSFPTYPEYRDNPHVPDCVWFYVNNMQTELNALRDICSAEHRRFNSRLNRIEIEQ